MKILVLVDRGPNSSHLSTERAVLMDRTVCLAGLSIKRAIFMDGTVSLLHLSTERGVSVDTRAKLWPLCSAALCLLAVDPHQRGNLGVRGQGALGASYYTPAGANKNNPDRPAVYGRCRDCL